MYYQRPHGGTLKGLSLAVRKATNKRDKESLVNEGRAHGILIYDGESPIGWCAYGLKTEFPRIDNGRNYRKLLLLRSKPTHSKPFAELKVKTPDNPENLWRITCFFVDRDYRKKGVARAALKAVLTSIKQKGGGIVEAYPVTSKSAKAWSKWSNWFWFGTSSMFETEKFKVVGPMGPHHLLMRRTVRGSS
jgi:GNAT superfamily N-acetyltransferase